MFCVVVFLVMRCFCSHTSQEESVRLTCVLRRKNQKRQKRRKKFFWVVLFFLLFFMNGGVLGA